VTEPSTTSAPGLVEPAAVPFASSPSLPETRTGEDPEPESAATPDAPTLDAPEPDAEPEVEDPAPPSRFEELVEERLRRARYAHHLVRRVFTPEELLLAAAVERRASVWVPTITFGAAVMSAVAAVVLASRLRSDPADPGGRQFIVVTVTVCLLAVAFVTLLRAEMHYAGLRPRGRLVRNDVADAYESVRDAPRRLVANAAPRPVVLRVAGLLVPADQLVDAVAGYAADGGSRVQVHPAYERLLRMRAEVEALEILLAERGEDRSGAADASPGEMLPTSEQAPDYQGLADLADGLLSAVDR